MTIATRSKVVTGHTSEAYGPDPSQDVTYRFRYKVIDLDDLTPSHTDTLSVNPKYPKELQPRIRERAASRTQIDTMAANLNAKVLLRDTGFLDTGPMIVGPDDVVESGNGRVLALRKAMQDHPEKYRLYKSMLTTMADDYGLDEDAVRSVKNPVLVRERLTNVDRVKFAADANSRNVLAMSPFEQAVQDASRLPDATIQTLEVGEDESIDQALRRKANAPIVAKFYESVPANERATIQDAKGEMNPAGMSRLKMAIFTKTYQGEAGQRLARTFSETLDPTIKSIENAMFASLPDMAKAEALIGTGARDKDLSIAPDMAEVIDTYASIKATGGDVDTYLQQSAMFEERLNPLQKTMLTHLDSVARSPKKTREFLRDTAERITSAPAKGQGGMFGADYDVTKEKIVYASINKQRTEAGKETLDAPRASATDKGLEKSDAGGDKGDSGLAKGDRKDEGILLAPSTSVQTGLTGFGKESAQVEMFGEVSGKESKKETLIDVEKEKAREAAKPLPGQIAMAETSAFEIGRDVSDRIMDQEPKHGTTSLRPNAEAIKDAAAHVGISQSDARKALDYFNDPQNFKRPPDITQREVTPKPEGQARVTFNAGDIDSTIAAAKRHKSDHTLYVFATARGYRIHSDPPPGAQQYVEVRPDGSAKHVSFDDRLKEQEQRWKTRVAGKVHDPRSAHAEAIDRAIQAKTVVGSENEWKPRNRVDLDGVDTRITPRVRLTGSKTRIPR